MNHVHPEYSGNSIVNLAVSIGQRFGVAPALYPPLAALPAARLQAARVVVLLVIDGLGHRHLTQRAGTSRLAAACSAAITSVFPSTTATAITSLNTGVAPQQHGLTGWFSYLPAINTIAAVLPGISRGDRRPLPELGLAYADLYRTPALSQAFNVETFTVLPEAFVNSPYSIAMAGRAQRLPYQQAAELPGLVGELAQRAGSRFIYVYYPDVDSLSHARGNAGAEVAGCIAHFDQIFQQLLAALPSDALVIGTADHGFVDTSPATTLRLEDHPALQAMLERPLAGEPRVAYCQVRADAEAAFVAYCARHLSAVAECRRVDELLAEHWYGLGPAHPELAQRIGNYALITRGTWTIRDQQPQEIPYELIGVHGGTSADEMWVPLLLANGENAC